MARTMFQDLYPEAIGVIGGSGLSRMGIGDFVEVHPPHMLEGPFGQPSGPITMREIGGKLFGFLPRHGEGHRIPAHKVPARANAWALRDLGIRTAIGCCAVGSLRKGVPPGTLVIPSGLVNDTQGNRPAYTFFDEVTVHISRAELLCEYLGAAITKACSANNQREGSIFRGGSCVVIPGPGFGTPDESHIRRLHNPNLIVGMTQDPEATLCAEAGIRYAVLCLVTDYDVWRKEDTSVDVSEVTNALIRWDWEGLIGKMLERFAPAWEEPSAKECLCTQRVHGAIQMDHHVIRESPDLMELYGALLGPHLQGRPI
ncbi:MAG: MTAP family purine nucleoside phosphorylase [Candidatus Magasanikbacteria bacterium]|jgi:5'-methylthioadenosine phosphorylase|nr:MTAP family purine nucleoside phosphorylase [Candidatus Magasanikbacteria bacterium]MBT4221245.1 MTAP family purine nucleoside phosphorylase [Candidatus Magasanikbacteria bacterium]MBT4350391.1 MTAP family purine nucleoside phosphorylase [Candidatus Magasanikbacteria bacterium]MBT4542062.1 MTAP family purine nucleoside phosphorylase [Candidatus Magasanikbacteria bacterium]MBT6253578.1 MTAP family purine nucleoside phosphorylase [Candidatus Magasanikbacteria bacterium]